MSNSIIQELKRQITCRDVLQRHGVNYNGETTRCPFPEHEDKNPSFSIYYNDRRFKCFGCGQKGDCIDLEKLLGGGETGDAIKRLTEWKGINIQDTRPVSRNKGTPVAEYIYKDEEGNPLHKVTRWPNKKFSQSHFSDGEWKSGLKGPDNKRAVTIVPFNLPKVVKAQEILILEGEKDVLQAEKMGFTATCNAGGAGKWQKGFSKYLKDKDVVIIPDNDKQGKSHADDVYSKLRGTAKTIRSVELPELKEKEDLSDWAQNGGTAEKFKKLITAAKLFEEPPETIIEPFEKSPNATTYLLKKPPKSTTKERCGGLNYTLEKVDGKLCPVPLPYNKVIDRIYGMVKDSMATIDDIIFSIPDKRGEKIHYLSRPADFFGRLGVEMGITIDWSYIPGAMKQPEAFSQIARELPTYRGIEFAPHHPEMPEIYYNYPALGEPNPEKLDDLIERFCPETDNDKALILAMFLTALWGGREGQRPAFIISSPDGRGTGKSSLGEMVPYLLNQSPISGCTRGNFQELITRILSPVGATSRVIIFDNEVGRVSSGELSNLITTQTISGKRLYCGEGRRPNNFLWIITLNTPTLDSDLASRSIPLSVKKPPYSASWKADTFKLIDENRGGILAELLQLLKESKPKQDFRVKTRWGAWEKDVLAKIPGKYGDVGEIQKFIIDQQDTFDDEADEISLICDGLEAAIRRNKYYPNREYAFFFPNELAAEIYNDATGTRFGKKTALRELRGLAKDSIKELESHKHYTYGRGFLWVSDRAIAGDENIKLIKPKT